MTIRGKEAKNEKRGIGGKIGLKGNERLVNLEINKIVPNPNQPRKKFNEDTIKELADSIKASEQLVPIIVSPLKDGRYLIVDGERRYRAAKNHLKLETMPVMVMPMSEEEIEINSLAVNVHRADLTYQEKEEYTQKLYRRLRTVDKVALRTGWSHKTVMYYLTGYNTRRDLVTRVTIKLPEDISTLVFDETQRLKDNPQARAEFIQMVDEERDGLKVNRDHLQRYSKIYAKADRDIQEKIYTGELTFQEAEKIINTIKNAEQKKGGPIAEEHKARLLEFFEDEKKEQARLDKFNQEVAEQIAQGNLEPKVSDRTKDLQRMHKQTDRYGMIRHSLRDVVIAHDIHFKAQYDDPDAMAQTQRMVMEVLKHVGSELNCSEEKRITELQEFSEYYEIVQKICGLMRPLVENEIKNSKTIDIQNLR
jgi:ParB/RepB/Spo0J family partition protein